MFFTTSDLFFYPQRQQRAPKCRQQCTFLDTSDDEDDFFFTPNQSCQLNSYYSQLRNQRIKEEQELQRQQQKYLQQQRVKQLQRAYQQKLEEELLEQELRNSFVKQFLSNKKNQKYSQSQMKPESDQDPFDFSTTDDENEYVFENMQKQQKAGQTQSQKNTKKANKQQKRQDKQQSEQQKVNTNENQPKPKQSPDNKKDKQQQEKVKILSKIQNEKESQKINEEKIVNLSDSDDTVISEEPLNYWEQIGISPQKNNLKDSLIEEFYSPEVESMAKQLSALLKKNYEDCLNLANSNKGKSIGQLIDLALNGRQTL
ncbi:hypothetical protein ABPG72_004199 [Tetrahymena utriculariae]